MLMKVDDTIDDLPGVLTYHALCKWTEVVQHLVQAPPSHPLYEDIDVALVLGGSQAADNVGMRETAEHRHLIV